MYIFPVMAQQNTGTNKKSIIKAGLTLSVMTLASRIMGLLREMTKAAFLGTSGYADAFGIAFMIPNLFRRLFAENAISVAFIPTFKGYLEEDTTPENHAATQLFISSSLTLVSFLTAVITVIGIAITPLIVPLFYSKGTDAAFVAETIFLTRIMFPYLFVISVLFNAIVIAVTYFLTPQLPNPHNLPQEAQAARAMSFGVLTGGCFQALFQWPFVKSTGWKTTLTSLKNAFTNPGTRKVVALIVPTIIGMAAYQLNDLVSSALAGKIETGTVSSLQYSLRLQELILGIFAVSIGTVILPDLSGLAKNQKWDEFNSMLMQAIKIIALITIPVTFYSLISGKEIISLLYKTRRFNDESVALTLKAFRFHIAGLFFIAVNRIISPAFYAQSNTKLPTLAGIISFGVNIVLALVLSLPLKGGGIALALSAASLVNTVFLFIFMKRMPSMNAKRLAEDMCVYVLRMISFSVIAAAPVYIVRPYLVRIFEGRSRLAAYGLPVLITALIFAALGILILIVFKDETALALLSKIKDRLKAQMSSFPKTRHSA